MEIDKELQEIMSKRLKNSDWSLAKMRKGKDLKQVVYMFYVYNPEENLDVKLEIEAKTPSALANKIVKYFRKEAK